MEFVILGFLIMKAFSQYELKKILEKKVSPFYSASLGSIQSALKKLMQKGLVKLEKVVENGRQKNIYTINDEGKAEFQKWMIRPINEKKVEAEASTRLFFFGLVDKGLRVIALKNIIKCLEDLLEDYEKVDAQYLKTRQEQEKNDVAKFQLKTLDLGIYEHECNLKWFKHLLSEMEEQNEL